MLYRVQEAKYLKKDAIHEPIVPCYTLYMIFFLIIGILLGIVSVIFVLQNTAVVTVAFLSWQMQGSLALVLFVAIVMGVLMTLLILLPSFIRDAFSLRVIRKQKRDLEEQLLAKEHSINMEAARTPPEQNVGNF